MPRAVSLPMPGPTLERNVSRPSRPTSSPRFPFCLRCAPATAALLGCLLAAAAPLPAQEAPAGGFAWPFGRKAGPGSGIGALEERDFHNLGLLGAKARDADRAPATQRGGRIAMTANPDAKDQGPERLLVEMLLPDGPASKAGLKPGDVLVGAGGRAFTEGSFAALAAALIKAEAAAKGVVALDVERTGAKGTQKLALKIPVPSGGADAAKPAAGKGRRAILLDACAWLAGRQNDDGGFAETLSGANGAVVQASLAGMAWLGAGGQKFTDNVDRAAKFVMRRLDAPDPMQGARTGGANWNQSNWGYVHAALFLAELQARRPSALVKNELQRLATEIGRRQEASGGWAHGPGGKNALDYLELNIVTGLALSALGSAKAVGCEVDRSVVEKAVAYCEASGGGGGGVGYSTAPGQAGQSNIGRTAAAWLGVENLGPGGAAFAPKARRWVAQNCGDYLGGHASLMQHILLAGVAAGALGGEAANRFWDHAERDLTLARAPDGSLQPRPWHESLAMGSNSDVTFGEVWTTAAWAIVLAADPKENKGAGLPVWTGQLRTPRR